MLLPKKAFIWILVLITCVCASLLFMVAQQQQEASEAFERQRLRIFKVNFEEKFHGYLYTLDALHDMVRQNPNINQNAFSRVASDFFDNQHELRSLQLARNNTISHVYPVTGNAPVFGMELLNSSTSRSQVLYSIENRIPLLSSPFELRQGGRGVTLRMPIWLPNAEQQLSYWGMAILVIDWQNLLLDTGFKTLQNSNHSAAIRARNPDGSWLHLQGDNKLFDAKNVLLKNLSLPGTQWQVAIERKPYLDLLAEQRTAMMFVIVLICLMIAASLLFVARSRRWMGPTALMTTLFLFSGAILMAYTQEIRQRQLLNTLDAGEQIRSNIKQRLRGNQDYLELLADEIQRGQLTDRRFQEVASRFVVSHPEMINITWVDSDFVIRNAAPLAGNEQIIGLKIELNEPKRVSQLARETRKAVYTRVFEAIQGKPSFELWQPVFHGEEFKGLLVAVYRLPTLIKEVTPEHLRGEYVLSTLVERSVIGETLQQGDNVQMPLSPPGNGLHLVLKPKEMNNRTASLLLLVASLLAGGIAWAVFALQRSNRELSSRFEELTQVRDALKTEQEFSEVTLNSVTDGVLTLNPDGHISSLNKAAESLLNCTATQAIGKPLHELLSLCSEASGEALQDALELAVRHTLETQQEHHLEGISENSGHTMVLECLFNPIQKQAGENLGVVVVIHNITALRKAAQELDYRARHDALTGLFNRNEFEHICQRALAESFSQQTHHTLIYLDLDQFKLVNDTCGHLAGDTLLIQISELLSQQIRNADALARLGGDEFGLLLSNCDTPNAWRIAESIRSTIREFRFVWDEKIFELGCSIGMVEFSDSCANYHQALAWADMACYIAKDAGRNRIHLYSENDQEASRRTGEMSWAAKLKRALEEDRFVLYRQPIQALDQQEHGDRHELLLRLHDDDGSLIPPGAFLPAAERYDLIGSIDRHVIKLAMRYYSENPLALARLEACSINLSGQSLGDDSLQSFIEEQFELYQMPCEKFCFEITETAAVANLKAASHFIRNLKQKGIRFALDDFGSGMSSFSYLKQLPVDYLKIDGCFIRDIAQDDTDRAMVESINKVGHVMQMQTVAEFVENDEIIALLKEIGVDYAQGYGIARPEALT